MIFFVTILLPVYSAGYNSSCPRRYASMFLKIFKDNYFHIIKTVSRAQCRRSVSYFCANGGTGITAFSAIDFLLGKPERSK